MTPWAMLAVGWALRRQAGWLWLLERTLALSAWLAARAAAAQAAARSRLRREAEARHR